MRNPNYVIGRGKLFFTPFLPGTRTLVGGSRYFGNSPALSLSQDEEKVDHYNSDAGLKVKDASATLQNDQTGSFSLDDISGPNLAMFFRGAIENGAVAAVNADTTTVAVILGTHVQLGLTDGNPIGARLVKGVTAKKGDEAVAAAGNFEVDSVTGRVYILPNASDIEEGDEIEFTYSTDAYDEEVVIAGGTLIEGRLDFLSDNAVGENRDYIWPYVQIRPDGDFSLKGDDWQTMEFNLEVLKLNDSTERQYIVKRPAAAPVAP